jgi:hypothetical protein
MAEDEDLDLTRDVVILAAPGEQTQQAAHGEVDKREQHWALQAETDREPAILLDGAAQANVSRLCEPLRVRTGLRAAHPYTLINARGVKRSPEK